jgi:hypothetical protein
MLLWHPAGVDPFRLGRSYLRVRRRLSHRARGVFAGRAAVREAAEILTTTKSWYPAIDSGGGIREGAWVAEATDLVDLSPWPPGTRLILRKERPHPGAQLRFTDSDGHRITGFLTDTPDGVIPGQLVGLELRHRQHTPASKTGSAKPRPPGCATCRSTLFRRTPPGSKSSWQQPI